jgi:hypothetical protein
MQRDIQTTASRKTLNSISHATLGLKAVKADDAEVTVYLWNKWVYGEDADHQQDVVLTGLCFFGLCLFWRGLQRDSVDFLVETHGGNWVSKPRQTTSGSIKEIKRDMQAIYQLLLHATQASWFEYDGGLQVHHF